MGSGGPEDDISYPKKEKPQHVNKCIYYSQQALALIDSGAATQANKKTFSCYFYRLCCAGFGNLVAPVNHLERRFHRDKQIAASSNPSLRRQRLHVAVMKAR